MPLSASQTAAHPLLEKSFSDKSKSVRCTCETRQFSYLNAVPLILTVLHGLTVLLNSILLKVTVGMRTDRL